MKICLAGEGAIGIKHLEALTKISGVQIISLAGGNATAVNNLADKWRVAHRTIDLAESIALPGLDAVILASPTPIHAAQAEQCMRAGKHVLVEIPMADNLADSEKLVTLQQQASVVAMAAHTRRFNPSHQWIHKRIQAGELKLQHLVVQTFFFRRTNTNAL